MTDFEMISQYSQGLWKERNQKKEPIKKGIEILENLVIEINEMGEKAVIAKYQK